MTDLTDPPPSPDRDARPPAPPPGPRHPGIARPALLGLIWLLLPLAGAPVQSRELAIDLSGFGTLGIARTSDDDAGFVRDLSQGKGLDESWRFENDSLLGIQASLPLGRGLGATAQAVAHYRHDGSFRPEITWAFLRYDPTPAWTLRAGRLGTEFYMLADSRMVGYSYVTVRPPVDYYATLPFNHIDGLDLAGTWPLAGGLLRGKLYAGINHERSPWDDRLFDLRGSLLAGGYLDFLKGKWQVRLGHARLRLEHDLPIDDFYAALPAATADELRVAGTWAGFTSLGLVRDDGPRQIQLMLSRVRHDRATFQDAWAGYLILSQRFGEFTPFVGLSAARSTPRRLRHPLPGLTDAYQSEFHTDQRTLLLGVRWDFMANLSLKAQLDLVRGDADSTFLYRRETPDWDGAMNVFSLALDFVF